MCKIANSKILIDIHNLIVYSRLTVSVHSWGELFKPSAVRAHPSSWSTPWTSAPGSPRSQTQCRTPWPKEGYDVMFQNWVMLLNFVHLADEIIFKKGYYKTFDLFHLPEPAPKCPRRDENTRQICWLSHGPSRPQSHWQIRFQYRPKIVRSALIIYAWIVSNYDLC